VRVIGVKRLRDFQAQHPVASSALTNGHRVATRANWERFADVRQTYRTADRVVLPNGNEITVFDIGAYRLLTYICYSARIVLLKEFLSHAEYDKESWKVRLDHDA